MSDHPVDQLDQLHFDAAAKWAHTQLGYLGHAFIDLQPDDATTYKIAIVRPTRVGAVTPTPDTVASMWVGTSFGPLYPWRGLELEWGYVLEHWLPYHSVRSTSQEWTARVIARFLNTLAERMRDQ